jgi:hypothetical protein
MDNKLDPRKILPGKNGKLLTGTGDFLAQVNTWQAQINFNNTDYQPAGQLQVVSVLTGYTVTLTFTETVVSDVVLLKKVMDEIKAGRQPQLDFQGDITANDGQSATREVFRSCVPDGALDLANISVGDIINRAWSLRVNEAPDMQSYLDQQ